MLLEINTLSCELSLLFYFQTCPEVLTWQGLSEGSSFEDWQWNGLVGLKGEREKGEVEKGKEGGKEGKREL